MSVLQDRVNAVIIVHGHRTLTLHNITTYNLHSHPMKLRAKPESTPIMHHKTQTPNQTLSQTAHYLLYTVILTLTAAFRHHIRMRCQSFLAELQFLYNNEIEL